MESKITKTSQSWMVSQFLQELDSIDQKPLCSRDDVLLLKSIRLNVTHFGYYTNSDEEQVKKIKAMVDAVEDGYGVFSIKDIKNMKSFFNNCDTAISDCIKIFSHVPVKYLPMENAESGALKRWRELYGNSPFPKVISPVVINTNTV